VTETITWHEFIHDDLAAARGEARPRQWIEAIPMSTIDAVGRKKIDVHGHRIAALSCAAACPLADRARPGALRDTPPFYRGARSSAPTPAAVDSELSLLAHPNYGSTRHPESAVSKRSPLAFDRDKWSRFPASTARRSKTRSRWSIARLVAERTGLLGRATSTSR